MFYRVYADNASTEKMRLEAERIYSECLSSAWGNASSAHSVGFEAKERLTAARGQVRSGIGADNAQVVFTSGATESINIAMKSLFEYGERVGKKHCVVSAIEHHAVLQSAEYWGRKLGFKITYVMPGREGIISSESVREAIKPGETSFVCVMYVNNEIGTIQPVWKIGRICRESVIPFFCDATQAIGHIEVDMIVDGIGIMCFSGHKFGGGYGTGTLCFLPEYKEIIKPYSFLGSQEGGYRAGTENVPAICAMASALGEFCYKSEAEMQYIKWLKDSFIDRVLNEIPGVKINGKRETLTPGIVNIQFEGIDADALVLMLNACGICVSTGSACLSGNTDPSYVLKSLGLSDKEARASVRFSFSHYTTVEDIKYLLDTLKACVHSLKEGRI